jgi:hypothetical protein
MTARKPPEQPEGPEATNPGWFPVTSDEFGRAMNRVHRDLAIIVDRLQVVEQIATRLGEIIVSSAQDVINAVAAELQQEDSDLNAAVTAIQQWIAAQPPSVDVSALQPLADQLQASVAAAAALVPPVTPPAGG